ncbi:MAG TPA: hypothetical protein VKI40_01675 [Terriglobales bacterium]|nr:hypothetical protein [Terriglobales bacterium]
MRPLGVTLVGFYQILRGILGLLFGLSVLLFTGLAAKLASLAAEGNATGRFFAGFGHLTGLVIIVFAALHLISGYGVLRMQNWGRLLTLFLSAIGLVLLLPVLIVVHGIPLAFGIINVVVILYLAMPAVKRAFHEQRHSLRMAA